MLSNQGHRRPPRNYLARREQWRLLALVMALGLVIFLMGQIRSPEARHGLAVLFGHRAGDDVATARAPDEPPIGDEEIAKLLNASRPATVPPGTFLAPADPDRPLQADRDPELPLPGIDRVAMAMVEDNAPFREREDRAWFNMFEVLLATNPQTLAAASRGPITYAQLVRRPNSYRGQIVSVRGLVRRANRKDAPPNDLGIEQYAQLWIQPAGGTNRLITAYCLELPNRFPYGDEVAESIALDGFFFKNWSYPTATQLGLAPVILARQLAWFESKGKPAPIPSRPLASFLWTAGAAALIAAVWIVLIVRRTSGNRFSATRRPSDRAGPLPGQTDRPDGQEQGRADLPLPGQHTAKLLCIAVPILFGGLDRLAAGEMHGLETSPDTVVDPVGPRALFEMAGIGPSYFNMLLDGQPLHQDEQELVLKLLYRIRTFSPIDIAGWIQKSLDPAQLAAAPAAARADFFAIRGTARRVATNRPPQEVMDRYEIRSYYQVLIDLDASDYQAIVVTPEIPRAWLEQPELAAPCSAVALFLKSGGTVAGREQLVFLANRIGWHPDGNERIQVNTGQAILGSLGVDVGLFDNIRQETPLGIEDPENPYQSADREPFYQILSACRRLEGNQLVRAAERNLAHYARQWAQRVAEAEAGTPAPDGSESEPNLTRRIAEEVNRQADEDRYSVAPLFRDAGRQVGNLFLFEGIVRRAVEIPVGRDSVGRLSDVVRRFGIERYYELDLFTPDSQNLPVVFCVLDLPEGFPVGGTIHEEVRAAGFFLKKWRYRSRQPIAGDAGGDPVRPFQLAPLLIGRTVLWIVPDPGHRSAWAGLLAGVLFIMAVGLVWFVLWRSARRDRTFHRQMIAGKYQVDSVDIEDPST